MLRFSLRRLLLAIPTLFGVALVVFITIKLVPGNPVDALLGPSATPEARAELTSRLGLNAPVPVQFGRWLLASLGGNLGQSIALQQPVGPLIVSALGNTLLLLVASLVIVVCGGMALGVLIARRRRGYLVRAARWVTLTAISAPQYTVALLLLLFAVETGAFPTAGLHGTTSGGLVDGLHHIVLPAVAAALTPMGMVARMFSVSLADVLDQEFVVNMRARGIPERTITRHAIHNSLPSLLTITGLQIGYLLGGVLFVEVIFTWPGLGQTVYQAISARDEPVVEAGVLFTAIGLVLVNFFVDTTHALIDPRVRA